MTEKQRFLEKDYSDNPKLKETIEYLDISLETFNSYIEDGKILPSYEIGTSHLFRLSDLRKLKYAMKLIKG